MTLSQAAADRIADRAASLWERLRQGQGGQSPSGETDGRTERRLDRWRQVVARGDRPAFEDRLSWDGLTLQDARQALACAEAPAPRPQWLEVFVDLIQSVEQYRLHPPAAISVDPCHPRPFEDVLYPLVYAARCRLRREMESATGDSAEQPRMLLSDEAQRALEMGLLDRLCQVCAYSLQFDFSRFRPAGYSLLNTLVGATDGTSTRHYREFVHRLRSADLLPMFEQHPVLARLVAVVVANWVAHCAEFLSNLRRDLPLLEQFFQAPSNGSPGEVAQLRFGLSDAHRQGRCVIGLTFSDGRKLAYKPKPLGIDHAFNQLVHWYNRQGSALELKAVRILDRPGYGWMEWLDQLPCADAEDARDFYQRAGMLLALLHVLRGTDCHNENMIACGGHLVLVDGETLMVPDLDAGEGAPPATSNGWFWQSVVRTGLLPRWETRRDGSIPCDITALGGIGPQNAPTEVPLWTNINTDDMDVHLGPLTMPLRANAATLDGVRLSPCDHVEDLVRGFEETYRLLLRKRAVLLATDGPLEALRNHPVRYVFRPTEQYGRILRRSLAPGHLQNGCDRSIELDHLSRGFLGTPASTQARALLGAELHALEALDYPRFEVLADDAALKSDGEVIAPQFFDTTGYRKVLERLASLSEADLALQTRIIKASVQAWGARSGTRTALGTAHRQAVDGTAEAPGDCERRRRFLAVANQIAQEIASSAIVSSDGTASWLGLTHLPKIDRYQLLPVSDGLYGGRAGVALFLAACDHVNRSDEHRSLVFGALRPLRAILRSAGRSRIEAYLGTAGIGIADGIGGLVYALTCIGEWCHDVTLTDDADELARLISPKTLESDLRLDVIGGAAGAILGLMKLYRVRPSPGVLRIVQRCAEWLCRNQRSGGEDSGAWDTQSASRALTGFAHGASGIAYALTQVHAVTREPKLLAAVRAAIDFEHRAFLPDTGNWIDYRNQEPGMPPSCATSWCHGAPGIGVARLAFRSEIEHPRVVPDLEAALITTQVLGPQAGDHLCCGSLGRVDILSYAAQRLGRTALSVAASDQAWEVLSRTDRFRMFSDGVAGVGNPGLFDGLAGIGYVLLRLVAPDNLPCVLAWE